MRLKITLFLIFLFFGKNALAQVNDFVKIKGLPTEELYNLFVDSKGFLWIGHDLGISRYDGKNFISYSNPDQTALSMSDILEDSFGRIWCHNFSGQIFYIENNVMHLLKGYNPKKVASYPRLLLFNNNLVANTDEGLFICNTLTLNCKYVNYNLPIKSVITSITKIKNTIIAYGNGSWFTYQDGGPLKKVALSGDSSKYIRENSSILNASSFKDTALMFSNPAGILSKIVIDGDHLNVVKKIAVGKIINTFNVENDRVWVNTIQQSFLLNQSEAPINGQDLTAIKTDHEGNMWCSSLKKGLMVKYSAAHGSVKPLILVNKDNLIKCIATKGDTLICGTLNGSILLNKISKKQIIKEIQFPGNPVSVNYLQQLKGDNYLVGTSIDTYEISLQTGVMKLYPEIKALKQADETRDFIFAASAGGLAALPLKKAAATSDFFQNNFKGFKIKHWGNLDYFTYVLGTKAVCFNPHTNSIFAAFKDGLYTIDKSGTKPFLYRNKLVHASCLKYVNGKVIIGTISDGLLITDGITITNISINEGLSSNSILKLKKTDNWIWIISAGATKIIDCRSWHLVNIPNLSTIADLRVSDIETYGQEAYVVTSEGLFVISVMKPVKTFRLTNYIQTISVNNQPRNPNIAQRFSYAENNIQFNLSVPFYYHASEIYFKYQLNGTINQHWQITHPGDRNITFSELSPGKYKFTAFAEHPQYGESIKPVVYNFSIAEQWWQTWLFKIAVTIVIAGLTLYGVTAYFSNRLRIQKANYDKQLSIQKERQRISSEMHDDVGAGLSAIKIFLDIASKNPKPGDIINIGEMINETTEKIHEIIWGTNPENDTVESLLLYLQFQALKLFKHTPLHFEAVMPQTIPAIEISGEKRQNIYLITKEYLHNALKHSKASLVQLEIQITKNEILIFIKDDGIGFNTANKHQNGNGLRNAAKRIIELKGKMAVESNDKGTLVSLVIPLG